MLRSALLALTTSLALLAGAARAQQSCEAKCNLQASECLKGCTGDPKDAQKPDQSGRLVQCLAQCEAQTKQCKAGCAPKP